MKILSTVNHSLSAADMESCARRLGNRLDPLRGATIFLTGCTGFIGKWLVEALLCANDLMSLNCRLHLLTRSPQNFFQSMPHIAGRTDLVTVAGSLLDAPESSFPTMDYVVHGANLVVLPTPQWAADHCRLATLGTERLFRLAADSGCRGALLLSSGAVYGTQALGLAAPFAEEPQTLADRINESALYGETKRFTELFAVSLGQQYNIRVPVARCFAFCGGYLPLNSPHALISFIRDARAGRKICIRGDGRAQRSYMYGSDMAVWLLAMLVEGPHGQALNVGSEQAVSIADLAQLVQKLHGGGSVQILNETVSANAPSVYLPSTGLTRATLLVEETVPLEQGLANTLEWFNNSGQA